MDARLLLVVICLSATALATLTSNHVRHDKNVAGTPVVINTWAFNGFQDAGAKAWEVLSDQKGSALDAVERGCSACEELQCDGTVGYGGSPDESGETTLDAMIIDGVTLNMGAVCALRRVKNAAGVARKVLDYSAHSLLAGSQATQFALRMGFQAESLSSNKSKQIWRDWKENNCQPNFWRHVTPDAKKVCGPYVPKDYVEASQPLWSNNDISSQNHDTIGMVAIDSKGHIAAGTSSNGATHKIPGRVGDSPIPGAGAYADQDVGGAAATGDGDVMMRFLPSFLAVEEMRRGATPQQAAETAIRRIASKYPSFQGAIVVLRIDGTYGASCHNLPGNKFPYTVASQSLGKATIAFVKCLS